MRYGRAKSDWGIALTGQPPGRLAIVLEGTSVGSVDLTPAYAPFWCVALRLPPSAVPWTIDIELHRSWRGRGSR